MYTQLRSVIASAYFEDIATLVISVLVMEMPNAIGAHGWVVRNPQCHTIVGDSLIAY